MPDVTFYWAGGGTYEKKILSELEKYDNFKFLGRLQYPEQVRQYLTEIDVYALVTGLDTLGVTILEAALMKKPVIATNVGAIPEVIENGKTGFTVGEGDHNGWIEKLSILLNDKKFANEMSLVGYEFVKNNFSWDKMANDLLKILNAYLSKPQ
ncbi:MAG: glycosyltransferase family 4 protein, partial [Nitrosopumilaceae archaeon]